MRILFLLDFFSSLGGVEFYNYLLIKEFAEKNIDLKIYIGERPKYNYWIDLLSNLNNIECYYPEVFHDELQSRIIEKKFLRKFTKDINNWKPDYIYVHPAGKLLITYFEENPKSEVPIISTEYTTPCKEASTWFCSELSQYINRIEIIVATCESVAYGLRNFHKFTNKIEVIPHLIPVTTGWTGDEGDINSIGCICRLSPEKGVDFLLGAWRSVNKLFPETSLHIYGHGKDEEHLKELTSSLGISGSVFFEGTYLPISGIDEVASRHRIFVQPSLFESIPTSILELIARKRAIIATAVGGIPEIISNEEQTGSLVEPASTDEISKAILFLLNNNKYISLFSNNGYEKFKIIYDFKKNVAKMMSLFANNKQGGFGT